MPSPQDHKIEMLPFVGRFVHIGETESTNSLAREMPLDNSEKMAVIWADRQSAGRGRRDRSFFSSHEGGLWVSLRMPVKTLSNHFAVNRAISLAICESIENCCCVTDVKIKWPNDIYIRDKKACGILLETVAAENPSLIVGFGINVCIPENEFPAELQDKATSLCRHTTQEIRKDDLLFEILKKIHLYLKQNHLAAHQNYRKRLYGLFRAALVDEKECFVQDVTSDGRLIVKANGQTEKLLSGTVTFL